MRINKKCNTLVLFLASILAINSASATLNWMKGDNFWFAGYMYIDGHPQLSYNLLDWDTNSNSWRLRTDPPFNTNTVINVRDILSGLHNCPYMYWNGSNMNSANIALVPVIAKGSVLGQGSQNQQFENDLKAGKYAPYIVMARRQTSIDIYIIGPVFTVSGSNVTQFVSRKLTFNFLPFENIYVTQSIWYKNLNTHWPEGIAFAPSFSVDMTNKNAYFWNSPDDNEIQFDLNKPRKNITLDDSALYLYGLENQNDALGWSWTHQGPETTTLPISKVIYQYVDKNNKTVTAERGIDQQCDGGGAVNMQNQCKICDSTGCYMAKPIRFDDNGMTLKALQDKGIVTYQSAVPLDELQGIINFLNSTGYAKFDNILQ